MLKIRGAVPEDAGNYTCLATNEAGTASQSVTISYAGAGVSGSVDEMSAHSKSFLYNTELEMEYITD